MHDSIPPRVAFTTLGCKVNQSETDALARTFVAAGYTRVPFDRVADVYLINTCTVTHVADRKSRQALNQARRTNPDALVVAAGCYASIAGDRLADDRTLVIRNRDKERIFELVRGRLHRDRHFDAECVPTEKYSVSDTGVTRARAMVKVQDGCDSHCTYCIIPRARGRSRSVPPDGVTRRVRELAEEGHGEVVITGVDLGSYGQDFAEPTDLGRLLRTVLDETPIARIRVSSVEPGDFDSSWLELWSDARLCRHLHVPLQSGSRGVLSRMERSYTPEDFSRMVDRCRASIPDLTLTTSLIVGFPGETAEEFEEGFEFVRKIGFDGMHVFKYSSRSGTRASKMSDPVSEVEKASRSELFRDEARRAVDRLLRRHVGNLASVVWETQEHDVWRGLSDTNVRVHGSPSRACAGMIEKVHLEGKYRDGLWSVPARADISLISV